LTVEHNGYVNGTAALSYLAERYPDATQVVVVGKTDGSVAAPVYGGLVADLLPDAQVTVFGGQSGHIPDDPDLNAGILGELWGVHATMPDWEVNEGLTARDWGPTGFWIQAGLHDPDIVLARFDFAYDAEAANSAEDLGIDPSELLAVIDANEAAIEAAGVALHSYTAPGDDHGIFEWDKFYELEVNDVTLVDWVDALLDGQPPRRRPLRPVRTIVTDTSGIPPSTRDNLNMPSETAPILGPDRAAMATAQAFPHTPLHAATD
jgi:hypothetical protein